MSEYKPFRTREPTGQPDLTMTMEEWAKQEEEHRRKLGPEVEAAEARTRQDYEDERNVEAPPTTRGGRYETQAWRDKLRQEAAFDAQGLPDSSPQDRPEATPGNRLPMR